MKRLIVAAALAGLVQLVVPAAPAVAATSTLTYTSTGTWTADPRLGRVHVDLDVFARSNAVDSRTRRYFYPALQLTLPPSTAGYQAMDSRGIELPVTVVASTASGVVVSVSFGQRLYSGQSIEFDLRFDVLDMGGSTDRDLRIGQDIVSFPVRGFGSPGAAGSSITVIFPAGYVVQEQYGTLTSSRDGLARTVFSSGPAPESFMLNARFTATRDVPPADFQTATMTLGTLKVTLRYWSDDPGWAAQVQRTLLAGYPILESLIGLGKPAATQLTIEEATTQGIGGFSGEYDQSAGRVRVSYFADPLVILHEMAHLWLNSDLVSDRWIQEGFASYYAEQAVLRLGLPDNAPALGPSLMSSAEPLNDWTSAAVPGSVTQAYFYGASLEAAREIADLAGPADLQQVWLEARSHFSAYADPGHSYLDLPSGGVTDWRRLLDYLENSVDESFTDIWSQLVVNPAQSGQLEDRTAAREDYVATSYRAGAWRLPPDVRSAMGDWQFPRARALLGQARQVLAQGQQINLLAGPLGLRPPASLRTAFETYGTAEAAAEANLELSALSAISAAERARAQQVGAARAVGLLGANPDSELESARRAFSTGDAGASLSQAEAARAAWAGAAGVGQLRIIGAALGGAGVLLLLALYLWGRPARRRQAAEVPKSDKVRSLDV